MATRYDSKKARSHNQASDAGRISAADAKYDTPVYPQNAMSPERLKELGPETRSVEEIDAILSQDPDRLDPRQEAQRGKGGPTVIPPPNKNAKGKNTAGVAQGDYAPSAPTGYGDPTGEFPRPPHYHVNSLNSAAKSGNSIFKLDLQGSSPGLDISDATGGVKSDYPLNQVIETYSGHVIEYNDTAGAERILIKHRTGAGVEFRPDGSMCVSAHGIGMTEVVNGDHRFLISGDGHIHYKGNLKFIVDGDMDVVVGGSYSVQAKDCTETYKGPHRELAYGNKTTTVKGNRATTVTQGNTEVVLGNHGHFIKGDSKHVVQGTSQHSSKGEMLETSESRISKTTPDFNMSAESMSIFSDTGTIGGENVIMYNYNMYTGHTVYAGDTVDAPTGNFPRLNGTSAHYSTFHGDLNGTAKSAERANTSAGLGPGGYSASVTTETNTPNDTKATAMPDLAIIRSWFNSSLGIKKVAVDVDDTLLNSIDRTKDTGGVSSYTLSPAETRAKMRDNADNGVFKKHAITEGAISPKVESKSPPKTGAVRDSKSQGNASSAKKDISLGVNDGYQKGPF